MKTLILPVGLPRSGKSTWSATQGFPIVNPDSIRLAVHGHPFLPAAEPLVWTIARYMVKALFLAGHDTVILDATNTQAHRRSEWISPDWKTVLHLVPTDAETCKARAVADDKAYLLDVIDRMAFQLHCEPPAEDGFEWEYV